MTRYVIAAATEILGTNRFTVAGDTVFLGNIGPYLQPISPQTAQRVRERAEELASAGASAEARRAEFPNLEPDQFWFVVRASGHEQELRDWVSSLNDPDSPNHDPMAWAVASAKLDFAKFFERDHPLVEAAREALGMTPLQLDDLWKYAALGSGSNT